MHLELWVSRTVLGGVLVPVFDLYERIEAPHHTTHRPLGRHLGMLDAMRQVIDLTRGTAYRLDVSVKE